MSSKATQEILAQLLIILLAWHFFTSLYYFSNHWEVLSRSENDFNRSYTVGLRVHHKRKGKQFQKDEKVILHSKLSFSFQVWVWACLVLEDTMWVRIDNLSSLKGPELSLATPPLLAPTKKIREDVKKRKRTMEWAWNKYFLNAEYIPSKPYALFYSAINFSSSLFFL